jgi:gluconolactonase
MAQASPPIDAGPAPAPERVVDVDAHEGPVYAPDEDALYFTTVPSPDVAIKRLSLDSGEVSVLRGDTRKANGMTLGLDGRLLVCEQGTLSEPARIAAVDRATGEAETVVDDRLSSPNDVAVRRSDGTIWFTDPTYGFLQGFRPEPASGDNVYRYDPATGRLTVVADDFDKPNGVAFSPDERVLYVTDSGANHEPGSFDSRRPHHIRAFDVTPGGELSGGEVFAVVEPGFPDGLKTDAAGRVYASSFSGVQVFEPDGRRVGEIPVPGAVNFAFGGPERDHLFITADTAVWVAVLDAKGA